MVTDSTRVKIEQAIAFGRSLKWMRERYGVTEADVVAVLAHMDAVNRVPDQHRDGEAIPLYRPHSSTPPVDPIVDQIVRNELAAIYSATVPEHRGRAVKLAEHETWWEKAQLRQATAALQRKDTGEETA